MKQKCGPIREWLGAYADGELDPARAEQVTSHLETCADCRRELDQIQELSRLAKSVEHPRLADDYWDWQRDRVWRGVLSAGRRQVPSRRPALAWARLVLPAVSAVVLLIVVIAGWRMLGEKSPLTDRGMVAERAPNQAPASQPAGTDEERRPAAVARSVGASAPAEQGSTQITATGRGTEKTEVGYAGRGGGAAAAVAASKPSSAAKTGAAPEPEIGGDELGKALASAPPAAGQRLGASSRKVSRIVSGPVLEWQPPLADADATDTGTVLLSVETDSTGRVLSAAVRRSSGLPRLDSVAVRQIRQSRFKAVVKDNRSVPSSFDYPFRLQKKQAMPQEQQKPQEKQEPRQEHKLKPEQNQSAPDNKSQKPDTEKQQTPLKEKTKK